MRRKKEGYEGRKLKGGNAQPCWGPAVCKSPTQGASRETSFNRAQLVTELQAVRAVLQRGEMAFSSKPL